MNERVIQKQMVIDRRTAESGYRGAIHLFTEVSLFPSGNPVPQKPLRSRVCAGCSVQQGPA